MNSKKTRAIYNLEDKIINVIIDCLDRLKEAEVTTEDINEYYGYVNDCQLTKFIKEAKESIE